MWASSSRQGGDDMEVMMARTRSSYDPSGAEVLGGCILALLKVVIILGIGFAADSWLGQVTGAVMSSFGVDTGFWTQYGLVILPESIISGGVLSALLVAKAFGK
jgi:hypothetical protein